ncbi:CGCGG family rSAM-modified RiPP protein [Haloplanus salilacus]|uniref:CGCGG family putative rSAM-modified RiPP protein n=1 Tax=Haloplanus salilacus TaxID=2949994 RepID=UPI0030D5166F
MSQHDDPETEHDTSWSANLEGPDHAEDRSLVVEEALDAVGATATGTHVNLVTHADHGHPKDYLYPILNEEFDATVEYIDQCGCGGYVSRVYR